MGDHHFHFQVTKVCVLHCLVLRVFLLFVIVLLPDVFQQGVRPGTSLRVDLQYVVFVYCCLAVAMWWCTSRFFATGRSNVEEEYISADTGLSDTLVRTHPYRLENRSHPLPYGFWCEG